MSFDGLDLFAVEPGMFEVDAGAAGDEVKKGLLIAFVGFGLKVAGSGLNRQKSDRNGRKVLLSVTIKHRQMSTRGYTRKGYLLYINALRFTVGFYFLHTQVDFVTHGKEIYLKKEISKQVKIRHIPELIFKPDHSIDYGRHIDEILDNIDFDSYQKDQEEE